MQKAEGAVCNRGRGVALHMQEVQAAQRHRMRALGNPAATLDCSVMRALTPNRSAAIDTDGHV